MSFNGKLYFSETSLADVGMYHCVVTLTVPPGQRFATVQPPSKTSLGIELIVEGDGKLLILHLLYVTDCNSIICRILNL